MIKATTAKALLKKPTITLTDYLNKVIDPNIRHAATATNNITITYVDKWYRGLFVKATHPNFEPAEFSLEEIIRELEANGYTTFKRTTSHATEFADGTGTLVISW